MQQGSYAQKLPHGSERREKGPLWKELNANVKDRADAWLEAHALHSPPKHDASIPCTAAKVAAFQLAHATRQLQSGGLRDGGPVRPVQPWKAASPYENTDTGSDMHYPSNGLTVNTTTVGTGKAWKLPASMLHRQQLLAIGEPQYALRTDFFPTVPNKTILTNHFEYAVTTSVFYQYNILDLGIKNRKKLRALFHSAILTLPFLRQNRDYFATNYIDTIAAWKPLLNHVEDGSEVAEGTETGPHNIPIGKSSVMTRFKYVKKIDTTALHQYASADPSYECENFDDIARCLNIVVSKSFGSRVHKFSSNKFFVKTARTDLMNKNNGCSSSSLQIIKGYYYTVKPGMGNIILNFNISTSAVFCPILVSEFMADSETFTQDRRQQNLKSKTVYISFDRKDKDQDKQAELNKDESRYWKFFELSEENIED
jgi:hypothetical protein